MSEGVQGESRTNWRGLVVGRCAFRMLYNAFRTLTNNAQALNCVHRKVARK